MGFTVYLRNPETEEPVKVLAHQEGGTAVLGSGEFIPFDEVFNYDVISKQEGESLVDKLKGKGIEIDGPLPEKIEPVNICGKEMFYLEDNGCPVGFIERYGTSDAILYITYNYLKHFKILDEEKGISCIDGKVAREVIPKLEEAIETLGVERDENYWKATPGNAGYALSILLKWARQHPEAVFDCDLHG